jgi:hypothetical protein
MSKPGGDPCMGLVKEFRQDGASFFLHQFLCSI